MNSCVGLSKRPLQISRNFRAANNDVVQRWLGAFHRAFERSFLLIFAPGETADHMMVWLPEQRILFPGDNWYYSFPNLYAIRGTAYRDFIAWANSSGRFDDRGALRAGGRGHALFGTLDMLSTNPVAPHSASTGGKSCPLHGGGRVTNRVGISLHRCGDAIMHVVSHTAAGMNAGQSMDDIAATISLPDHLVDKPGGMGEWSVVCNAD